MKRLIAVSVLLLSGCAVTSIPLWGPSSPSSATSPEVRRLSDVAYYSGKDADDFRHRADLFLPRNKNDFPVVVFVHGGAWVMGDNRCCGLYSAVAEYLAKEGIGVVVPNYRLSPSVVHPEHAKDIARAIAWTHAHIADYGGRPDRLFLAGHSAGGHLVALVATDESYLKKHGLSSADIKGVIAVSGVYEIPPGKVEVRLGGAAANAVHGDEALPLRSPTPDPLIKPFGPGIPASVDIYGPAFGSDPAVRRHASPLAHVRPGLPPFLLVCAEHDLPTLPEMAKTFERALLEERCDVRLLRVEKRNHNSILFMATNAEDPVGRAMRDFIKDTTR
ncbi:MAG: alpha/beta hydrolase [Gemmataceae bacterium]